MPAAALFSPFRDLTLKTRITLVVICIEAVLIGAFLANNILLIHEQQLDHLRKTAEIITRQAQSTVGVALASYDLATMQAFTDDVIKNHPVTYIAITDSAEKPYAASGTALLTGDDIHALQSPDQSSEDVTPVHAIISFAGQARGHLHLLMSHETMRTVLQSLYIRNFLLAVTFLAIGIFVAMMMGRMLAQRLQQLSTAVATYGQSGDYSSIPAQGRDEIAGLGRSIQKMIEDRNSAVLEKSRSETQYELIFENAQEGIFQVGHDGELINANPALAKILGYENSQGLIQALSGRWDRMFVNNDDIDALLGTLEKTGRVKNLETPMQHRAGHPVWVRLSLQMVWDGASETKRINGTAEDISEQRLAQMELRRLNEELEMRIQERTRQLSDEVEERKRTEEMLLEAKDLADRANESKSRFLAKMSHELRTPLNAIIGFSETMGGQLFGPLGNGKYTEYAQHIHDSGVHLLALINDILDLSKIEANALEMTDGEIDVDGAIRRALDLTHPQADKKSITLVDRVTPPLPMLKGDDRRFQQILLNLLSNAVKYTPDGGVVTLTAKISSSGWLNISIHDTGVGMAAEDIPKAFVEFGQIKNPLTASTEGTGLGLPLTRALVLRHEGKIHLDSELGKGTKVTISFPQRRFAKPATAIGALSDANSLPIE